MCQAFEGESSYMRSQELDEIQEAWRKHKSGESPLTQEQIKDLAIRKLMASES